MFYNLNTDSGSHNIGFFDLHVFVVYILLNGMHEALEFPYTMVSVHVGALIGPAEI